jgi:hypothetical protein
MGDWLNELNEEKLERPSAAAKAVADKRVGSYKITKQVERPKAT